MLCEQSVSASVGHVLYQCPISLLRVHAAQDVASLCVKCDSLGSMTNMLFKKTNCLHSKTGNTYLELHVIVG